ncbi:MAG TPA: hypothetical protein VMJ10_11330 [Kofleriaceae bacterium]|nr:hypothetical protein [Kofleriaceae bacterium]
MRVALGAVLLVLAGVLVYMGYTRLRAAREPPAGPGQPAGALVVAGAAGRPAAFVVLIDRVAASARGGVYRVTALDVATGIEVASRTIEEPMRCWPGAPSRMWCSDGESHTHLIAVPSFDAVTAGSADEQSRTWLGEPEAGCAFADTVTRGDMQLAFAPGTGTAPRALVRVADGSALPGAPGFVSPSFLRVGDPALVLVQHDPAVDRPGAIALSRLGDDLRVAWTAELAGRCETAHVAGDRLVVTSTDPVHRAAAIDLATGAVTWRYGR